MSSSTANQEDIAITIRKCDVERLPGSQVSWATKLFSHINIQCLVMPSSNNGQITHFGPVSPTPHFHDTLPSELGKPVHHAFQSRIDESIHQKTVVADIGVWVLSGLACHCEGVGQCAQRDPHGTDARAWMRITHSARLPSAAFPSSTI